MLKLGKKPFTPDARDFRLASVEVALPPVPQLPFGYGRTWADWGMLGNDNYGDCVFAGADHETMLWNHLAGNDVFFDESDALADYGAVTGFDPSDPNSDQGTEVRAAMSYRKNVGLIDVSNHRHKIDAYVSVDPKDWNLLLRCIWTFGVVGIGFEFPDTAFDQFNSGQIWDLVNPHNIEGGHYVPVVGSPNTVNQATCITWGKRQVFTRAFYEAFNDESWVPLTQESLLPASNVRHIDWKHLTDMLNSL